MRMLHTEHDDDDDKQKLAKPGDVSSFGNGAVSLVREHKGLFLVF